MSEYGVQVRRVRPALYASVRERVQAAVPTLDRCEVYTAEQLYGPEAWSRLSRGEQLLAGLYLARMVSAGLLPLCLAPTRRAFPRKYRLR
jgi:hypothetical protein